MSLPLHELASSGTQPSFVRLTEHGLSIGPPEDAIKIEQPSLIPVRQLQAGEQYRFHFNMTKCIGCRSCEVACNEQNGNPADIRWRRVGEIEGGTWPNTSRHYLSMGCNHCLSADCLRGCPVDAFKKDLQALVKRNPALAPKPGGTEGDIRLNLLAKCKHGQFQLCDPDGVPIDVSAAH